MRYWPTVEACLAKLSDLPDGGRTIQDVVLHHTWDPDHATWSGGNSAVGMKSYWLQQSKALGYTHPLGAHFCVDPKGGVYAMFEDMAPQLSSNSNSQVNVHGVSIETVGNFDSGHDILEGKQEHAVHALLAGLLLRFGLSPEAVHFHRNFTNEKTCPGTSLDLTAMRAAVGSAVEWIKSEKLMG